MKIDYFQGHQVKTSNGKYYLRVSSDIWFQYNNGMDALFELHSSVAEDLEKEFNIQMNIDYNNDRFA